MKKTAITNKNQEIIVAFAIVEPFFDIPETNGKPENDDEDIAGSEPLDEPLERQPREAGEVEDPEPVKESDLDDLEPNEPEFDESDDDEYADLDDDEDLARERSKSTDDLGHQADYVDLTPGPGTDLRDGSTII